MFQITSWIHPLLGVYGGVISLRNSLRTNQAQKSKFQNRTGTCKTHASVELLSQTSMVLKPKLERYTLWFISVVLRSGPNINWHGGWKGGHDTCVTCAAYLAVPEIGPWVSFWMQVVPQFHNYENLIRAVRWQNLVNLWMAKTIKTCSQEIDARRRQIEDSNEEIQRTWPVYIIKKHWWIVFDNSWGGKVSAETWDKEIGKGTAAKLWTGSVLLPWLSPTSCCQLCCQAFDWNRSVAQPIQQDSL